MTKCKLGPLEHAQSISKCPARSIYIGSFITYLLYLPVPFPRDLFIDLEGSNTLLPLTISMHIYRLSFFNHLYKTILNCFSMCLGSWFGATTLCMEVKWCCTIAVSAWCSMNQLPGINALGIGLMHLLGAKIVQICVYMAIFNHIYMHIRV